MVAPDVHELSRLRARNEFLEAEHSRTRDILTEQADTIARLRSALRGLYQAEVPDGCPVCIARAALR